MFGKKKKDKEKDAAVEGEEDDKEKADAKPEAEGEESAGEGEGEAAAEGAPPKKSKKKLIIAIVAVLVLAGAGAGVYFSGILNKKKEEVAVVVGPDGKPVEKPIYYTLPDFLVNLNSQGKSASFLKASVVLEVAHQADIPLIEANLPRVSDAFTTYLRELRPSDLAGSAGIQRLREELLLRVNNVVAPVKINDVLFKDVVVQ